MRFFGIAGLILASLILASCKKGTTPQRDQPSPSQAAKRYHLMGKVVSVDQRAKMANIDGEAIPGFMDAMTMPYQVKPPEELNKLAPGEAITADVVVQGDSAWLENIAVTGHASAPAFK